MSDPGRGTPGSRSALVYKLLAVALVACFVGVLVTRARQVASNEGREGRTANEVAEVSPAEGSKDAPSGATSVRAAASVVRPVRSNDPDDLANYVMPGEPAPKMEDVIDNLHKAGIHTGLGVVGVALGVIYGAEARRLEGDLEDMVTSTNVYPEDILAQLAKGNRYERNMYIGTIIGGLCLGTGGVLYYLGSRTGVEPAVTESSVGAIWKGSF